MTPNDQDPRVQRATGETAGERILDHNRLQLSAFLDGELPVDEARFLLRRLQHDDELRGCWERWQLSGDVMRGRVGQCVPGGFSARVASAVAAEAKSPAANATGARWLRWGGGAALAASVAVIALFLTRQAPELRSAPVAPAPIATAQPVPVAPVPVPATTAPAPAAPDHTPQLATGLIVADVPRRIASRRSRGQSQRAARRSPALEIEAAPIVAAAAAFPNAAAPIDPFSGQHVRLPNRPWPRALLPGAPNGGMFNVDYGSRTGTGFPSGRLLSPFGAKPAPAPVEDTEAGEQHPQ